MSALEGEVLRLGVEHLLGALADGQVPRVRVDDHLDAVRQDLTVPVLQRDDPVGSPIPHTECVRFEAVGVDCRGIAVGRDPAEAEVVQFIGDADT